MNSALAALVITLACVLAGWLLYRVVETPFMQLRDRRYPTSFPDRTTSDADGIRAVGSR